MLDYVASIGNNPKSSANWRSLRSLQNTQNLTNASTEESLNGQRSGGKLPDYYLAYVDKYGQIIGSDFDSSININIDAEFISNDSEALKYQPWIEGDKTY